MSLLHKTVGADAATSPSHPLDRLLPSEIDSMREIVASTIELTDTTKFVCVDLEEPAKAEVLSWQPGDAIDRRVRVMLLDLADGRGRDMVVSLTHGSVESQTVMNPSVDGHMPVAIAEFELVDEIVKADQNWLNALADRDIDPSKVQAGALSSGNYDDMPTDSRILRVVGFFQPNPDDLVWAHPIDGLVALVDVPRKKVVNLIDYRKYQLPAEKSRPEKLLGDTPMRTDLKPIEITQPEGPSFAVDGDTIDWGGWNFRIGFNVREGLTLHQVSIADGTVQRPVMYRASLAEMVVPYGDPSPVRFWQNYFDLGEYLFGRFVNSLELGCDCLGEIHYFDAVISNESGAPQTIKNAICLHEEDYGVLWKHSDMFADQGTYSETRRSRRLVVSFFTTVGNYDYGFYWYFYLDGTIECEAKLTGVLFPAAWPEEGHQNATHVAPGLAAPFHQHLFSMRLDMMIDGLANAVEEVDAVRQPVSPSNVHGNAFGRKVTRLRTEAEGQREANGSAGRVWHILNTEKSNRLGDSPAYALHSEHAPVLLAADESSIAKRAGFAQKHLWVTRYHPNERYSAGDFVNQHKGGDGLPAYAAQNRDIDGQDIVLWHTFGPTHFPRPEDWPIMPTDYAKFKLKPVGFFDRNPTLNVPPSITTRPCGTGCDG